MKRLNRGALSMLGLSAIVALAIGIDATPPRPVQAGPVVSGTVNIGNTPLPVTLSGEAVSGAVVVTRLPATQAFEHEFTPTFLSGFNVPDGKQFVAEEVSIRSDTPGGFAFTVCIGPGNGCGVDHWVSTATAVNVPGEGYVGSSLVRFYAGPGKHVQFFNGVTGTFRVGLTGHMEDVP